MVDVTNTYLAKFEEFFVVKCKDRLEKLAEFYPEKRSFEIDYRELEEFDIDLADELINKPYDLINAAEEAIEKMHLVNLNGLVIHPHVRFFNLPSENVVLVKNLNSSLINKFISVEGVVTKITEVKPKLVNAVFECNHCGRIYNIPQNDESQKLIEPGVCTCDRKSYTLLTEQSSFIDTQKMALQENLEMSKGGEQTRKVTILLEDDLTNFITPGNKLRITGILRLKAPKYKKSVYDLVIDCNHVSKIEKEFEELELTEDEKKQIIALSKDPKLYDKIVGSIAPSIYGHTEIKEAIALQLFGGTPGKVKSDGIKIRPDMHILLIGDPGVAKSQLLKYVDGLAPKSIYTSGKSSSAAGLTATAEKDEFADGGWTLKAGALVLAAGGIALIDEFDKMSEEDRSSMHEAMESQEIHVAKAGMIATFKANTSILAAANPKFGRFDPFSLPAEQFNIPPTLISRFDLIFPIRDELDVKKDTELAEHILVSHFTSGVKLQKDYDKETVAKAEERVKPDIEPELLRDYIAYARSHVTPVLTSEAIDRIKNFYLELRKLGEKSGSIPITARYLEGIVRLAEASAKGRLSNTVDFEDAERAIKLMSFSLKSIGVDPETGRMDIDVIATGSSKSKTDKIKTVYRLVKKLNTENGEASKEAIIEEAKNNNVKPEDVEEILSKLKRSGEIYSPKYGVYKPTGEK